MNVQDIHLDIDKRVSPADVVRIGQGDAGGTTIRAHIFDNGVAADLTGMTARFEMRQPNTTNYVRDINCTVEGNVITYVVDEDRVASVAGITDVAYFDILDGEDVIYSTERFSIDVLRSARDGATPAQSWDTEIDQLIERGEQAVDDAEQAVSDATSAIDAANQAIARIEPTIEQAAEDAAEQATADAEQRIQDAIEAMGEISELAVPLMSPDTRGGAKLEEHGGLALRDGALGIGSLVQESNGYARGGLAQVTAKGHAEQVATTGKNLLPRFNSTVSSGITYTVNSDGSVLVNGTSTGLSICMVLFPLQSGTYTLSGCPSGGSDDTYKMDVYTDNTSGIGLGNEYGSGLVFTLNEDLPNARVRIRIPSGVTVSNLTFYPQLELGSTATAYEPYTGGAPSPSPDYPQEIQVVRGHEVTGKTGRFVDLEVRDANDQLLSTTPIPLPQRGWVAGLPDGTADSLRLDGAGKCEWKIGVYGKTLDGSDMSHLEVLGVNAPNGGGFYQYKLWEDGTGATENNFVYLSDSNTMCNRLVRVEGSGVQGDSHGFIGFWQNNFNMRFRPVETNDAMTLEVLQAWLTSHPMSFYVPMQIKPTEDCGYVDMPAIPSDAQISIPELDALGIKYFVDDTVTQYGREIIARVRSEYADRLTVLEQAVAELVTS